MNVLPRDRSGWEQLAASLRPQGRAFINGRAVEARDGRVFEDISPIDGSSICAVARCDGADVEAAVTAARASFEGGAWRRMEPKDRKRVLRRFAELIRADRARLALLETRDVGKPIVNSVDVDVANCADCIEYYAEFADKLYDEVAPTGPNDLALVRREPLGVVAAIVPWNYPLIISCWKLGPALLTGNSVVLKPAEQSPLSGIRLGELACEAGVPPGVFNVVPGYGEEAGKALALHPDVDLISFTGSTEVGRLMLRYAGRVEPEARRARMRRQDSAGGVRRCRPRGGGARHRLGYLLQQRRDLPRRLAPHRASVAQGRAARGHPRVRGHHHPRPPARAATQMGALIDERHMQRVLGYIEAGVSQGARIALGGHRSAAPRPAATTSRRPCSTGCATT